MQKKTEAIRLKETDGKKEELEEKKETNKQWRVGDGGVSK